MHGYTPNALALPLALTAAIVVALGLAIALRERFTRPGRLHLVLAAAIAGFQACMAGAMLAQQEALVLHWMQYAVFFALLIAPLAYLLSCTFTGQRIAQRRGLAGVWAATGVLAVCHAAGLLFVGVHRYQWGVFPGFGAVGWMFVLLTAGAVLAAIRQFWRQYRGNRRGSIASRRALLMALAIAVGALGTLDFLPAIGVDVVPLGGIALLAATLIMAVSVWRYRLVEISAAYAADQLMDSMSDGVLMIDRDGVVRLANPAAAEILGIDRGQLLDRLPPATLATEVLGWQQLPFFPSTDMALGERAYVAPDGTRRVLDVSVVLMREHGLDPAVATIGLRDITATVNAQEQIERLAYYDPLTHLPNRLLLRERFGEAIARAKRGQGMAATLFMDLDRFKQINDTLGHDAGDMLLKAVAERIGTCVRETDWLLRGAEMGNGSMLARLGGDEFVLLLSPIARPEDAAKVASRILEALARPFSLKRGAEVTSGASIGISIFPNDGDDAETLMKKADLAMYQAKESGRNLFRFHDEAMNASMLKRTDLHNSMRRGLSRNEFLLHYQPQVACRTREIAGLDAQVYWRHPQHGLLPAAEFVSASEDSSVVVPLTEWVVRSACMQLRAWVAMGLPTLYLSLTLPPGAAERGDLPRLIHDSLAQAGVDPGLVMVSLRGGPNARDATRTREAMQVLQSMGVRQVLDDFGAGDITLSALSQYPLGMVRFDSGFLRGLARDGDVAGVTRSLISMVHALNLGVIVTGVDAPAQAAFLRDAACDLAQGAAYGAPVAAEDVPALLSNIRERLAAG
jgi:diguanylate cyclase (GGDEF)-like protein/PAS domain S-box-containing protein